MTALKKYLSSWRTWELALLVGIGVSLCFAGWLTWEQSALADKVIRLHVIANSDSAEDQELKLLVRDRILEETEELFQKGYTVEQVARLLTENMDSIVQAGQEVVAENGYDYPVSASMEETYFPTKEYTDFALPAGNYTALRVVIGAGGGQNWWCVVFPPLCLNAVTETAQTAMSSGFSEEDVALITGESEGYVVKFKCMELWDEFRQWSGL